LTTADDRQKLLDLILDVSFERREVTLASGKKSNFYLDLRQTLMRPLGVELAGKLVLEKLQSGTPVDAVGGMAVGAVPLVSAVLGAAARSPESQGLLGFFVRKEAKGHGQTKRIEGNFKGGDTVVVIDDVITTGGSTLKAIEAVENEGGKVAFVAVLVDRQEGGRENIENAGYPVVSAFTKADLLDA